MFYYQKIFGRQFKINPDIKLRICLFRVNIYPFHSKIPIGEIDFNITNHKLKEMILTVSCVDDDYHQRNLTLGSGPINSLFKPMQL